MRRLYAVWSLLILLSLILIMVGSYITYGLDGLGISMLAIGITGVAVCALLIIDPQRWR